MDKLELAQNKVDQTKSLMEDSVASMSQNSHYVESKLLPNAVDLAVTGQDTEQLAEEVEREEKCRRCRILCICFVWCGCFRSKQKTTAQLKQENRH